MTVTVWVCGFSYRAEYEGSLEIGWGEEGKVAISGEPAVKVSVDEQAMLARLVAPVEAEDGRSWRGSDNR